MDLTPHTNASEIAVDRIAQTYAERSLGDVSDVRFVASVGAVIERSRAGEFDSFVLHAPLELAARAALLSHVSPSVRLDSRLRMLSIAARYEAFGPPAERSDRSTAPAPAERFIAAVQQGDPDRAEASALELAAEHSPSQVVTLLADFMIPLTSAAAHASIFLHLLQRSDPRGSVSASLLAPLARELARDTGKSIQWATDRAATGETDAQQLQHALRNTPSVEVESAFIHPVMAAVDTSGLAEEQLGEAVGQFDRMSASSILRVAAESMIHDTPTHAPYGWTHCLTLPQAVIEIAPSTRRPDHALAIAATHVLGFRAALGEQTIPDRPLVSYPRLDMQPIIDAAARHHDAHVAKYVLACLDAAAYDPDAQNLYHAAAAHLLDVWESIPLADDPLAPDA